MQEDSLWGNFTEEFEASVEADEIVGNSMAHDPDAWDSFETIAAPRDSQSYVEVVVGVLSAVSLLLLVVFVVVLVLSRRHKLQGSPTTILRNPFGATINMKVRRAMDLLMNLAPMNNGLVHVTGRLTPPSPVTPATMPSPPPPPLPQMPPLADLLTPTAPPVCPPSPAASSVATPGSTAASIYYERQFRAPLIEAARRAGAGDDKILTQISSTRVLEETLVEEEGEEEEEQVLHYISKVFRVHL
ncbi:hypothetical protein B566_EDAN006478 [Ephemera danica]|nr:hypothetical protein B566_EDAN006478 [Ephemera danica]